MATVVGKSRNPVMQTAMSGAGLVSIGKPVQPSAASVPASKQKPAAKKKAAAKRKAVKK